MVVTANGQLRSLVQRELAGDLVHQPHLAGEPAGRLLGLHHYADVITVVAHIGSIGAARCAANVFPRFARITFLPLVDDFSQRRHAAAERDTHFLADKGRTGKRHLTGDGRLADMDQLGGSAATVDDGVAFDAAAAGYRNAAGAGKKYRSLCE